MNPKDLINWAELSRLLSGHPQVIRSNRYTKRDKERIERLLALIEGWMKEERKETPRDVSGV